MTALLVFNELSCAPIAADSVSAKLCLDRLARLLFDARIAGRKALIAPPYFLQMEAAPGYSIGRWMSQVADRDLRLRLKALSDRRIDYGDCVPGDDLASGNVEYRFDGSLVRGLYTAYAADGLAVSLLSEARWNVAIVRIEKAWVEGEDVLTRSLEVPHAADASHLDDHQAWLRRLQVPPPVTGMQLWQQRASLFPNLDFCDSTESQIKELGGDGSRFREVLRGLRDLQRYCDGWTTGDFDIHSLNNASGESEATLAKFGETRKFRCPDGQKRLFNWHAKRGHSRIHFFDFPAQKRLLVGYVGRHLPTAKFN
jgi:hypothetical protein